MYVNNSAEYVIFAVIFFHECDVIIADMIHMLEKEFLQESRAI